MYTNLVLDICLGRLSLPRNSVLRLTDRPYMTITVYCGCKATKQQQQNQINTCVSVFTKYNILQVMESEEFMLLPINQLVDIISSDELNVRSEEQVYNAIMGWVKYNIQERRPNLPTVS